MKKILFFIPSLVGGGAEKVLVNLVNNINTSKFDVTVLTLFNTGRNKKYLNPNINYKYIFNRLFRGNIHLLKLFNPQYLARKLIRDEYDIAISYLQGPTTRIISGIENEKTIKINWVHRELTKNELKNPYRNFEEFINCYEKYDSTVFVSITACESFERATKLSNNHLVKYNTVETDKIRDLSNEKIHEVIYRTDKLNLITVGRLANQKGYDRLLPLASRLISEGFDIHIYILGEGPLENNIKEYIQEYNLEESVTMLGYKDNPYKYVKQADLFVCSSYSEGFSTAVTEALIVGTPVITTRVSGMKEILGSSNEYGLIVENNTRSLYKGLKRLLLDKKLLEHYRKKAIERSSFFNTQKTVKEIEDLFLELHSKK